jgi:predicted nucleotidyltransferase
MIVPMAMHHQPPTSPDPSPSGGVTMDRLRNLRPQIMEIAAQHGASNVRVFGSVSRGEADATSDVDFLVRIAPDRLGFAYFGSLEALKNDLSTLLGCTVDVIDSRTLRPLIREEAMNDALIL